MRGAKVPVDAMIIANQRAENLGDLFFIRNIQKKTAPPIKVMIVDTVKDAKENEKKSKKSKKVNNKKGDKESKNSKGGPGSGAHAKKTTPKKNMKNSQTSTK